MFDYIICVSSFRDYQPLIFILPKLHALKDKVYRAVEDFNKEQDGGYKYHVIGGGDGTVSPSELHNMFYVWGSFSES